MPKHDGQDPGDRTVNDTSGKARILWPREQPTAPTADHADDLYDRLSETLRQRGPGADRLHTEADRVFTQLDRHLRSGGALPSPWSGGGAGESAD